MDNTCKDCIWYDQCSGERVCDNFTSVLDECTDFEYIDHIDCERRMEFYDMWNEYIEEFFN